MYNQQPSVTPTSLLQLNPQQRTYEVSRQSPHSTSTTASSSGRRDTYTTRPPPPAPPVELTYVGQRRRSIASSVASNNQNNNNNHSSSARRRSDHFRDADKIYSIGPEETGQRSARGEDKIYDSNRPNRWVYTVLFVFSLLAVGTCCRSNLLRNMCMHVCVCTGSSTWERKRKRL